MGEENKSKNTSSASTSRTMEGLSFEINRFPKDLLQRSMSSSETLQCKSEEEEEKEEIELNLGLSLGGRFGVDRSSKKLTRSSSIAGSIPLIRDDDAFTRQPVSYPVLMRTSSLPTETEEEWRKRKELQCLRRMEAKRRRSEKQKNLKGGGGGTVAGEGNLEEEKKDLNVNRINWRSRNLKRVGSGVSNTLLGFIGQQQQQQNEQLGSLGSVESQGGTSSGISEMESKNVQGSSSIGEARSPANNQSLLERNNQDIGGSSGTETKNNPNRTSRSHTENLSKKLDSAESRGKETGKNAMEEMPCVFTKGDGPNGRRVDGILYKYGKGAEIRIMCVCHGSFLSPAEFVKHAGGGDVGNPLRHIVVNSLGSSFL